MNKLIKNEFYKIFHKKSCYVLLGIIFLFIILINFIYKSSIYSENTNNDFTSEVTEYQQDLKQLDKNSSTYLTDLAYYSAQLDTYKLAQKNSSSWKSKIILNSYNSIISSYYEQL